MLSKHLCFDELSQQHKCFIAAAYSQRLHECSDALYREPILLDKLPDSTDVTGHIIREQHNACNMGQQTHLLGVIAMSRCMLDHGFQDLPCPCRRENDPLHQECLHAIYSGPRSIEPSPGLRKAQNI